MEAASRHNEGVVVIAQHPREQTVTIVEMNEAAQHHLGLAEPLTNHALSAILGIATHALIEEELGYEPHTFDLLDLLSKQRTITLKHANGSEHAISFNITRMMADARGSIFRLIFAPRTKNTSPAHAPHTTITYDKATELPDATYMMQILMQAQSTICTQSIQGCFVYLRLRKSSALYSPEERTTIIAHSGRVIQRNLRSDDMVARMGDDALGILLMDVNMHSVHLALHRIHRMILCDPPTDAKGQSIDITIQHHAVLIDDRDVRFILDDAIHALQE